MDKKKELLYNSIANRSFETKLNLYSFKLSLRTGNELPELDTKGFNEFSITHELVDIYTSVYWQTERDKEIEGKKVDDIYRWIKGFKEKNNAVINSLKANYVLNFNEVYTERDFEGLLQNNQSCHYCGITLQLHKK